MTLRLPATAAFAIAASVFCLTVVFETVAAVSGETTDESRLRGHAAFDLVDRNSSAASFADRGLLFVTGHRARSAYRAALAQGPAICRRTQPSGSAQRDQRTSAQL